MDEVNIMWKIDEEKYSYEEIREDAVKPNATKEERVRLLRWMERYALDRDWNGEYWDIDKDGDGKRLYPIDKPCAFEDDGTPYMWETIDCEIR